MKNSWLWRNKWVILAIIVAIVVVGTLIMVVCYNTFPKEM